MMYDVDVSAPSDASAAFGPITDVAHALTVGSRESELQRRIAKMQRDRDRLDVNVRQLRAELERLHELRSRIPAEDPYHDGEVLLVRRSRRMDERAYTYAALRVAKRWWITGSSVSGGLSWRRFVEWLLEGHVHQVTRVCPDADHRETVL